MRSCSALSVTRASLRRARAWLLLRLRFELDHFVNLRPVKLYPVLPPVGGKAPADIDMVVVREERRPYAVPAVSAQGTSHEVPRGEPQHLPRVERVVRDAFDRATRRPRRTLTLVHRTTSSPTPVISGPAPSTLSRDFPTYAPSICTWTRRRCSSSPTPSDLTSWSRQPLRRHHHRHRAAIAGGIGRAASGNLDMSGTNPACSSRCMDPLRHRRTAEG